MATKSEIATEIARLQKEHDAAPDDDDDLEVEVERDGTKTRLRGKHARKHLKKLGLDDDEDQGDDGKPAEGEEKPEGDEKPEQDDGRPPDHRYFRRTR